MREEDDIYTVTARNMELQAGGIKRVSRWTVVSIESGNW